METYEELKASRDALAARCKELTERNAKLEKCFEEISAQLPKLQRATTNKDTV